MTAQVRAYLKSIYENGDVPQGSDYVDVFDSFVSISDTTVQSLNSPLTTSNLGATTVSAASIEVGDVSAQSVVTSALTVNDIRLTGAFSAATVNANVVNANSVSAKAANVSALTVLNNASVSGRVQTYDLFQQSIDTSVAATGSSQSSAKQLGSFVSNIIRASTTAQEDGVRLGGGYPGLVQYIVNRTSQSAKVYPPTGGTINSAAANAAVDIFPVSFNIVLHESSAFFILHRGTFP